MDKLFLRGLKVTAIINTPLGKLGIVMNAEKLAQLRWAAPASQLFSDSQASTEKIIQQLQHYFADGQSCWDLPLAPAGTPFQQKVRRALQTIPPGATLTYGELARQLHTAPRAIGQACRTNPLPIIIPCHRILAAKNWGGYSGKTAGKNLVIKKWLLQHEGVLQPRQFS